MSLYIGVEGVGLRQSVAVASDERGEIVAARRLVGSPITLHTTPRHVLRTRLMDLLCAIKEEANCPLEALRRASVCVGLTGVTFRSDAVVDLPEQFKRLEVPLRRLVCTGDAEIVFVSHARTMAGTAILCHMGSTAYASLGEETFRYGGWGPVFGDEGSGYWIGSSVLRAIAEEHDAGQPASPLWELVDRWFSAPEDTERPDWAGASYVWLEQRDRTNQAGDSGDPRTALFGFAHAMRLHRQWEWRAAVSSLTIPLRRAWDQGNETAAKIWDAAAEELCGQYERMCRRAKIGPDLGPLVIYGGVVTHNRRFRELVLEKLAERQLLPSVVLSPHTSGTLRPACGALLYALGRSRSDALRLPDTATIDRVEASSAAPMFSEALRND